jgi:hypothetical protein
MILRAGGGWSRSSPRPFQGRGIAPDFTKAAWRFHLAQPFHLVDRR